MYCVNSASGLKQEDGIIYYAKNAEIGVFISMYPVPGSFVCRKNRQAASLPSFDRESEFVPNDPWVDYHEVIAKQHIYTVEFDVWNPYDKHG